MCFDSKENSNKDKSTSMISSSVSNVDTHVASKTDKDLVETERIQEVQEDEEDNADVNFEVRAEKLSSRRNSVDLSFDEQGSIYDLPNPTNSKSSVLTLDKNSKGTK